MKIMRGTVVIKEKIYKLFRVNIRDKNREISAWKIINPKGIFIGIVRQEVDGFFTKQVGYRNYRIKFWLASNATKIVLGNTRKEAIEKLEDANPNI